MEFREAVDEIRRVGVENARIVSVSGSKVSIMINVDGSLVRVVDNINRNMAEDIIRQASNRVILG